MLSKSDKEAIEINTLSKTSILSVFLKINPVFDEAKRVFEWFYSKGILPVVDNDAYIKIKGFSSNYFLESNERRNLLISFLQKADMSICDVVFEKIEPVISEQLSESFKNYKVDIETKDMVDEVKKHIPDYRKGNPKFELYTHLKPNLHKAILNAKKSVANKQKKLALDTKEKDCRLPVTEIFKLIDKLGLV